MKLEQTCPVCGGTEALYQTVLWPALVVGWGLTPFEEALINRREGVCCSGCGCSLRTQGLAAAMLDAIGYPASLTRYAASPWGRELKCLSINTAGGWLKPDGLTDILKTMPGHVLACYPEHDMQALKFPDGMFAVVLHSDTLEHVANPVQGLRECRRVLKPGGRCIFTVPELPGKLSRSREYLTPVYHANPTGARGDVVHTDFGADAWRYAMDAGFRKVTLRAFDWPAALAWECIKE